MNALLAIRAMKVHHHHHSKLENQIINMKYTNAKDRLLDTTHSLCHRYGQIKIVFNSIRR